MARIRTQIRASSVVTDGFLRRAQRQPLVWWVQKALKNLGNRAHLTDIYREVEQLGYSRGGKDLHKLIRSELQKHSSNSDRFSGNVNDDLFATPKKRSGIWELRDMSTTQSALAQDLDAIATQEAVAPTTKKALVDARLGQGRFRTEVL
jgi:hypothetical protein